MNVRVLDISPDGCEESVCPRCCNLPAYCICPMNVLINQISTCTIRNWSDELVQTRSKYWMLMLRECRIIPIVRIVTEALYRD